MSAAELPELLELVRAEQVETSRNCAYLGSELPGIHDELEDLDPLWTDTARVIAVHGSLVGAVFVEVDREVNRAWVHGPWVAGPDELWAEHAQRLLAAALEQLPAGMVDAEVSGHVDNVRLASLVGQAGWERGVVNHALVADEPTIRAWEVPGDVRLRTIRAGDASAIAPILDNEFPGTYMTAARLESDALRGEAVALVAISPDGSAVGFAAGRLHADGEGFIDFVAVDLSWRGRSLGRALVVALGRRLLGDASRRRVSLMVQEGRVAARGLYRDLGFTADGSFVGYRSVPMR